MNRTMVAILFAATIFGGSPSRAAESPLVITTLPFDNPGQQKAVFGLLSRRLSQVLGRPVRFQAGISYANTIERLAAGRSDVGFLGAAAYVRARKKGHVRAILRTVRHGKDTHFGVILVQKDSPAERLKDLEGKRVAFVDERSTTGYVYPALLLRSAGLHPETDISPVFVGNHRKVVEEVAKGAVAAGACFEGAQESLADPTAVRVLARTEAVPGDPVVVRPGLGPELLNQLRAALVELSTVSEAKPFFTFAGIDGFVPAIDSDYDRVAELMRQPEQ